MASAAVSPSYRLKARLTGDDTARAGFRVDLAALQAELGECATESSHGAEHSEFILFGELAAYFSIVGEQTKARAAVALCALGKSITGSLNPRRQWLIEEANASKAEHEVQSTPCGFLGVTTGTRDYHATLARDAAPGAGAIPRDRKSVV